MAEIEKPQYHNPKQYPSDRRSFNVNPARTDFARPSSVPNTMHTVSNVMDSLIGSLNQYQEIYANSEKTANVLQAKSLLLEKAKDTQRIRELLATELPNTGYQHLKLKDVLDKYRTKDVDGKSDLYLGSELQHNITGMEMPDDLSEEVRSMVEDQWITDETAIVSDLIGQVTQLQGKQTLAVLNQHEAKFKQDVMRIYQTQGRHAGAKEANNLRLKMIQEIEELGHLGTWTPQEVSDKKHHFGQLMLNAEFAGQYWNTPEGQDPVKYREGILQQAVKGNYKYKNENGDIITLDSIYYDNFLFKDKDRIHNKTVSEIESATRDTQRESLLAFMRQQYAREDFNFNNLWQTVGNDEVYGKISKSERYEMLWREELRREREAEQKKKTDKSEKRDSDLNDLGDLLAEMSLELTRDFDGNISKYADRIDGKWQPKGNNKLKKLNPELRTRHISKIIEAKERTDQATQKGLEKKHETTITNAKKNTFVSQLYNLINSGPGANATILLKYGKRVKVNGDDVWIVDHTKLDDKTAGGKQLLQAGIGRDLSDPDRKYQDVIAIRQAVMTDVINKASIAQKKYTEAQKKALIKAEKDAEEAKFTVKEFNTHKDQIASVYIANLKNHLTAGGASFQNTFPTFGKNIPDANQLAEINALYNHMNGLMQLAYHKDSYTVDQLKFHMQNGIDGNLNNTSAPIQLEKQHRALTDTINNHFRARITQLEQEPQQTGFDESQQEAFLAKNGVYNLPEYFKWLQSKGILEGNKHNVLSKDTLTKLSNIGQLPTPKALAEYLNTLPQELDKYGTVNSQQRLIAFAQMEHYLPMEWDWLSQMIQKGQVIPTDRVEEKWIQVNQATRAKIK
tara:strand:- start:3099 stop:5651 length:2553 start_codon:yes stop_codon:yes gene_type:complete